MRWHLYMPMCQSKMADRQNYFQSYKGAEEGILLSGWTVGDGARWSLGRSTPNLAALHSSPTISPPASNTQHSSPTISLLQATLLPIPPPPSQQFPHRVIPPKSGLSIYPTAHILSYFLSGPVERANQNCRRKRVLVSEAKCGGLPWEARRAPTTKPRMSWYTSIYKPCVFYMSWCTSNL